MNSTYRGMTVDPRAYRFMRENAGYIVGEKALGAFKLARAEAALRAAVDDGTARVRWEDDDDFDAFYASTVISPDDAEQREIDEEIARQAEIYGALGCVIETRSPVCETCGRGGEWEVRSSVWGVVGDDDYRRVVEAEQALEAGFGE
jgi:hypothetical protein